MPDKACDGRNVALNCQVFHSVLDRPKKDQVYCYSFSIPNNFHKALWVCHETT